MATATTTTLPSDATTISTNDVIAVVNNTRDEGLLGEVLEELDRQRSRRAELEQEIRQLREQQAKWLFDKNERETKKEETKPAVVFTEQDKIRVETERDGFRELIDALTADNDAIATAIKNPEETLPLHIVRLFEIIPWDPRAKQFAKATEEVYEWQVYKAGKWHGVLRQFPQVIRKLPIVEPKPGVAMVEESMSRRILGEAPPQHCVLTDDLCTRIVNLDKGFPLPENGGYWAWIGGWRVDKHVMVSNKTSSPKQKVDCDDEGWSYAESYRHFVDNPTELCWDNCKLEGKICHRPWRRRKWTRQRALISYPRASERSTHYLRVLAENERNAIVASKLSDQLVETKTRLTETEERLFTTKDGMQREIDSLKEQLKLREEEMYRLIEVGLVDGRAASVVKESLMDKLGKEGVDKVKSLVSSVEEAISSATQSLRKPEEKTAEEHDEIDAEESKTTSDYRKEGVDNVKNLVSSVMATSTTAISSATQSLRKSSDASDYSKSSVKEISIDSGHEQDNEESHKVEDPQAGTTTTMTLKMEMETATTKKKDGYASDDTATSKKSVGSKRSVGSKAGDSKSSESRTEPKSPPLSKQTADWITMGRDALIKNLRTSHSAGSALFQNISRRTPQEKNPVEEVALPNLPTSPEEVDAEI